MVYIRMMWVISNGIGLEGRDDFPQVVGNVDVVVQFCFKFLSASILRKMNSRRVKPQREEPP